MSDNIPPYEIQLEIIKRVPDVRSLIRLRSVSKLWKSYIDSSKFISGYGVRDMRRLLLRYKESRHPYEVKYVSFIDNVSFRQHRHFAPNVPLLIKQLKTSKVIGSSSGLWCFHGYDRSEIQEMVVICNPSIRKAVGIVVPPMLNISGELTHFGFGVCPSTYDPTIVGMSRRVQWKYEHNCKITWQVGIFTLSSKTWKMLPTSNLPRESIRVTSSTQVTTDRFIFWVAENLILSFDLITHEFKEISIPDIIANQFPVYFSISKLNDSLVVSAYTNEVHGHVYGVWMMGEEGGAMTSFKKIFTINTTRDLIVRIVLGYKKSGEPIIGTQKNGEGITKIKVYDPCQEHINDLGITGIDGSFFISPYTETLLLADHSDGCIIPNSY